MKNHKARTIWIPGYLLLIFAAFANATQGAAKTESPHSAAKHPNVLMILVDDMGYADLNINNPRAGSPTPHLNELARSGVRFTRFYTESSCSPSRAALLMGRYPARAGFIPNGLGIPGELTTLPKAFKAAGYRTHQIGKWHLGHLLPQAWPDAQGFDTWLGFLNQWLMTGTDRRNGFDYAPTTHTDAYLQNETGEIKQYPGHLTDISTDEAIRVIGSESNGPPWFMYLAYLAPHEPIEPRADYAARFPATPAGRYQALVAHLDDRIGDILHTLQATGQLDRTIVVFASDNGGTNNHGDNNTPFNGKKTLYLEGGIRTPLLISWPGAVAAGQVTNQVASIMDIYPTVARLARLPNPAGLDGRTLFNGDGSLIEKLPPRTLFWEVGSNLANSYSVLSSDGRWRIYQNWLGGPSLFDLQQDPASGVDVAAAHPDTVRQLQAEYDGWKTAVAHIDVTMRQRDAQGHGVLVGDNLQRAVTFGGFTIAIGITPAHRAGPNAQIILEQKSALRIDNDDSGLHVQLHGLEASLPTLPEARCSSLVITGTFNRRIEAIDFGASTLNIYVDRNKVSSIEKPAAYLHATDVQAATHVGHGEGGSQRFDGILSMPIYLNTRAEGSVPDALTVPALSAQVCPEA